jgi:N utilization substance protein A
VDPNAELGGMVIVETTPKDFGRVAAQTARQVIQQRIREAEREAQLEYFNNQLGEIVSGVVQAISAQAVTLGLDMKAEGIMPRNQQIPGERFRLHDRVRALLAEVKSTPRGPQLILSRAHRNFLRRLLENEVPEIYHGLVEIRSIAREPGQRSKVAVAALQPGVDPVGACVGMRGVRIQAIVRELNDEKIDVIEWNPDPAAYIAKALSPARVTGVYLNEHAKGNKTATVVVPEDQLSLAIGRDGQNARLAAKLTAWRIDIKSLPEAAADAMHKLQTDPEYANLAEKEAELFSQIEAILTKKNEGRPVTPEEYAILSQFVDRVERGIISMRQAEYNVEKAREQEARAKIPAAAFETPLQELGISDRIQVILVEAGYPNVGNLMVQLELDPDAILSLDGIGPKTMETIQKNLSAIVFPGPETGELEEEMPAAVVEAPAVELPGEEVEAAAETREPEVPEAEPAEIEPTMETPFEAAGGIETQVEAEGEIQPAPVTEIEALIETQAGEEAHEAAEEPPASFDEIFALKPEAFDLDLVDVAADEEEEEEDVSTRKKKKKKKKKKFVEMEYDPDKDVMIVKRVRKRGDADWDDNWEF